LKAAGVDVDGCKIYPHSFGYTEQLPIVTKDEMKHKIFNGGYDVIQIFNSDPLVPILMQGYKGKVVIHHTGTRYRENPSELNRIFNPIVWKTIHCHSEFFGLGAINENLVTVTIDVDKFTPNYDTNKEFVFAHYPSNPEVKGTKTIKRIADLTGINFKYSAQRVNHEDNIARMHDCDVYIELHNPTINGKKYGHFGNTALEAAAMGKVVITQNLTPEIYEREYGECPMFLARDEMHLAYILNHINSLSVDEMVELKKEHRKWVQEKHSFKAQGERLKRILCG
jgi:hypothetical protein